MVPALQSRRDEINAKLLAFGLYWLFLGLIFEPFEGGIKKDHSTLSFYFVTTGLAVLMLLSLTIWLDQLNRHKAWSLLVDAGQNPMIAYVGIANAIWPVLYLTRLQDLLLAATPTPWLGFIRGVVLTVVLALLTQFFTRHRLVWRT